MARAKKKSKFVSAAGVVFEFVKAISDEVLRLGGDDDDLRKVMSQPCLAKNIAELIMGREEKFPSLTIAAGLIPERLEIVQDVKPRQFKTRDLEVVSFLQSKEEHINGKTLRSRAINYRANLGISDAKYIMDHQGEISSKFRGKQLVFPGTLFLDEDNELVIPYLVWNEDHWKLCFYVSCGKWDDSDRLVRCKQD